MIIVKVELHSAITGEKTELARMMIDNIGGDFQRRNYRTRTLRGRSADALEKSMREGAITCEGRVLGHRSAAVHVWNLVAKALDGMGYGE